MDNQQHIVELETTLLQANPLQPRGIISPDSLQELVDDHKISDSELYAGKWSDA